MIKKLIATAAFATAIVASANAESFEARFTYDANASAAENYADFRATAAKACKADMRRGTRMPLGTAYKLRAACEEELVTSVVAKLDKPTVTALHQRALETDSTMILARAD